MTIPQRFQSPTYLIAALTILWLLTIGIIWTIMQAIGERWEVGIFFGRFHILVVHLPIGLLLGAAAMEAIRFLPPLKHLSQGVLPMLWLAALGSVMATILGFLLMLADDYQGELIRKHMWTGLGVVVLVALTLWIKLAKFPEKVYLTSLFASVVLISISGHFGGDLVHGKDYLVEYAPGPLGSILNPDSPEEEGTKELAQRLIYGDVIQPVFDAKCVECHFEGKVKGKLRMDSFEELAKGGDYGQEFIPGNADDSELVYRVELDPD
ncbi:MAG: c-type cytochrome domain-containing protein, partial [Verrucomicrobiota bacterium]